MSAARKNPDVSFEARQELDIDAGLLTGYVIPQGRHRILRMQLCTYFP
jgi:hypothetical protein